jgi:hypothetical protein
MLLQDKFVFIFLNLQHLMKWHFYYVMYILLNLTFYWYLLHTGHPYDCHSTNGITHSWISSIKNNI